MVDQFTFHGNIPQVKPENMRQFMANTIDELLKSLNYVDAPERHSVGVTRSGNGRWHIDVIQGENRYTFTVRLDRLD